jgi:hypothetical protein
MNHRFLSLDAGDRQLALNDAALRLHLDTVILEKDFWVSWLLGLLFAEPELAPHLVFKGGTSLSKVYGVIDRFSEDIDLCLAPAFVGADAAGFDALGSRVKRDAAVLEMQRLCLLKTESTLVPILEQGITRRLGAPPDESWLRCELDVDAKSPIVYFRYPSTQAAGLSYLAREVKLELGTLTDQQPTEVHPVRPMLADAFPALFEGWNARVTALALQRTFWEKATILHSEFHRPPDSLTPDRYARHYFDMARLLGHAEAPRFLNDKAQCERVVDWKSRVFARGWARYDLARAGSFRLTPADQRRAALAQDYARMRPMFLSPPPAFADLLDQLAQAEHTINQG